MGMKTPPRSGQFFLGHRLAFCSSGKHCLWFRNPTLWPFVWMLFACSEEAGIPEGRGQCWMLDKPCVSLLLLGSTALGPGRRQELCQQAVICKEIGFADIIKTPLSGHMLGSFLRPFPSTSPAWPKYCRLSDHVSPGAVLSPNLLSASRDIFLKPESDRFPVLPRTLRGSALL